MVALHEKEISGLGGGNETANENEERETGKITQGHRVHVLWARRPRGGKRKRKRSERSELEEEGRGPMTAVCVRKRRGLGVGLER